jgi:hypothetical protein
MTIKNFCFLSEANYPNYAKRIKDYSIPRFLQLGLDIPFYISTNYLSLFSDYNDHPFIRAFDIEHLRKNNINSQRYELLPQDPTGLYPARYPWNLRRFILEKAIQDGYNGLLFIECDTKIHPFYTKNSFLDAINRLYEPDTVKTSSARFVYANRAPSCVFDYHDKYISDLNLDFSESEYDSLDGTNQLFFGKNTESLTTFINNWHFICDYGYEKPWGYKSGYLSNLSFIIPMSGFKLIHTETPFITEHVFEDRY